MADVVSAMQVGAAKPIENQQKQLALDDKVADLEKWQQLLDSGVITQEEFDKKKKEILGL